MTDDMPDAKRKTTILLVLNLIVLLALCALIGSNVLTNFLWIIPICAGILFEAVWMEFYLHVAFYLTVTEEKIRVRLLFRRKVMYLEDIESYEYTQEGDNFTFLLQGNDKTLTFQTKRKDKLKEILLAKTNAVDVSEQNDVSALSTKNA